MRKKLLVSGIFIFNLLSLTGYCNPNLTTDVPAFPDVPASTEEKSKPNTAVENADQKISFTRCNLKTEYTDSTVLNLISKTDDNKKSTDFFIEIPRLNDKPVLIPLEKTKLLQSGIDVQFSRFLGIGLTGSGQIYDYNYSQPNKIFVNLNVSDNSLSKTLNKAVRYSAFCFTK